MNKQTTGQPDNRKNGQMNERITEEVMTMDYYLREFLIVEYLERASWRDFADGRRVETVVVIAIARLDKDGRIRETLCVHLSPDVVEMHAWKTGKRRD